QPANARFDFRKRLRNSKLYIEKPVIDRSQGDPDGRTFILVRERGEPGHRFDHPAAVSINGAVIRVRARRWALPEAAVRKVSHTRRHARAVRRGDLLRRSGRVPGPRWRRPAARWTSRA